MLSGCPYGYCIVIFAIHLAACSAFACSRRMQRSPIDHPSSYPDHPLPLPTAAPPRRRRPLHHHRPLHHLVALKSLPPPSSSLPTIKMPSAHCRRSRCRLHLIVHHDPTATIIRSKLAGSNVNNDGDDRRFALITVAFATVAAAATTLL
ncbi:hypothetical protein ACLOJK_023934, partial [Asimina triloba]